MFKTFKNMLKHEELRGKILFTLGMMFIFRLGSAITIPNVDASALIEAMSSASGGLIGMINLVGGGSLEQFSIFALGVGPYITASIVIELLSMDVIPAFSEWKNLGDVGRKKRDKAMRYFGLILAFVQAYVLSYTFSSQYNILISYSSFSYFYIALVLSAGAMLAIWIGDQITAKGIGNGVSMLILAGIVGRYPSSFIQTFRMMVDTSSNQVMFSGILNYMLFVLMYLAVIIFVVFIQEAIRKIPIQYASSTMKARKHDSNHLPIKINSAGVVPVIFASSFLMVPVTAISFLPSHNEFTAFIVKELNIASPTIICLSVYLLLIIVLTFFYANLQINPQKISEDLSKSGAYIPGIRPGTETSFYITRVLNRVTVTGALSLAFIAGLPIVYGMIATTPTSVQLGGTGLIIVASVAMDTVTQIESQLASKTYKGFTRK